MTVLMTARFDVDPARVEAIAKANPERLQAIVQRAKNSGVIAHRFYGRDNGVFIVDQWPDEESFRRFFTTSPEITQMMVEAGVTADPEVTFYRALDVDDVVEPATTRH